MELATERGFSLEVGWWPGGGARLLAPAVCTPWGVGCTASIKHLVLSRSLSQGRSYVAARQGRTWKAGQTLSAPVVYHLYLPNASLLLAPAPAFPPPSPHPPLPDTRACRPLAATLMPRPRAAAPPPPAPARACCWSAPCHWWSRAPPFWSRSAPACLQRCPTCSTRWVYVEYVCGRTRQAHSGARDVPLRALPLPGRGTVLRLIPSLLPGLVPPGITAPTPRPPRPARPAG